MPPHDLSDGPVVWPTGPAAGRLSEVMEASRAIVGDERARRQPGLALGPGPPAPLPSFEETHGVQAGLVTAVDLVRGLGVLTDMDVVDVPGATGWYDTDYEGKRDAALEALAGDTDLFVIHVEATDEAGHAGDVEEKVRALENWDRRILAGLVDGLDALGDWRLLLLPDHATPLRTQDPHHRSGAVPAGRLPRRRPRRHLHRGRRRRRRGSSPATS